MLGAIGLALAGLAGPAWAAPGPAQQAAPVPVHAAQAHKRPAPRFQPAPVPGQSNTTFRLSAPVAAPYSGTAYHDLGGQPETSADALASQGAHPR